MHVTWSKLAAFMGAWFTANVTAFFLLLDHHEKRPHANAVQADRYHEDIRRLESRIQALEKQSHDDLQDINKALQDILLRLPRE